MRPLMVCCLGFAMASALALGLAAPRENWPVIQSLHLKRTFTVVEGNADTPFFAVIKAVHGESAYELECHNGNYDDDSDYNFSGTFQCALFAVSRGKRRSWNLLAANTKDESSTDWWNRGRMLSSQLRGKCLAYPAYSTDRHFRLRGMLITMRFTNLRWSAKKDPQGNPMLAKFTFTFDAVPDRSAQSATAKLPEGPKPPPSCFP